MAIDPDTKDWTWVLERACPECGLDARRIPGGEVAARLRDNLGRWRPTLGLLADPARRPTEDRWSALEYACHVRDVFKLYDERLALMLTEDDPTFPNWDQDASAVEQRYNEQDAAVVLDELEAAAEQLARAFDGVTGEQWQRTGTRSDGARFTVDSFARYMVHDPVHHLRDIQG